MHLIRFSVVSLALLAGTLATAHTSFAAPLVGELIARDKLSKTTEKVVYVDFSRETPDTAPGKVKSGQPTRFRLVNVNRVLYDVTIEGKTLTYNATPPDGLKNLLGVQAAAVTPNAFRNNDIKTYAASLGIVIRSVELQEKLKDRLILAREINDSVRQSVKSDAQAYVNKVAPDTGNGTGLLKVFEDNLEKLSDIELRASLKTISKDMANDEHELATTLLEDAAKVLEKKSDVRTAARAGALLLDSIIDDTVFYAEYSMKAGGDAVEFTYDVKPKQEFQAIPTVAATLGAKKGSVKLDVVGGWAVNFSAGLFLSNLADDAVTTAERTSTTTTTAPAGAVKGTITSVSNGITITDEVNDAGNLIRTEKGRYIVGLPGSNGTAFPGALAHVYPRLGWDVQPALSIGGGVTNENPFYAAGVGFIFGRTERRVVLSLGVVYGKVKRLASDLQVGQPIPDSRTDVTGSSNRLGSFASITVNF